MDEIYALYNKLIVTSNDYSVQTSNNHRLLNINVLKNNRKYEIDSFLSHFVRAFKYLSPKLHDMNRLVYIKELAGHIEIKEDGYQQLWMEYQLEIDQVIKHFNHIKSLDNDINMEYLELEKIRSNKLSDTYSLNQILSTPINPVKANQLSLF